MAAIILYRAIYIGLVMFNLIVFAIITLVAIAVVFIGGVGVIAYALPKSLAKFGAGPKISGGTSGGTLYPTGWSILHSQNMPATMAQNSDGYYFDFPSSDGVHYVVKPAGTLQQGQVVTMEFNVSGPGAVVPVQGSPPAKVSLFIQRKGDNLSGQGAYQQYRYWHSSAPLNSGDGSLSAPLNPGNWTDVFGKPGSQLEQQFKDCLANAEMIGFTFGDPGAGATGHGAYATGGSARFTLKKFSVDVAANDG